MTVVRQFPPLTRECAEELDRIWASLTLVQQAHLLARLAGLQAISADEETGSAPQVQASARLKGVAARLIQQRFADTRVQPWESLQTSFDLSGLVEEVVSGYPHDSSQHLFSGGRLPPNEVLKACGI